MLSSAMVKSTQQLIPAKKSELEVEGNCQPVPEYGKPEGLKRLSTLKSDEVTHLNVQNIAPQPGTPALPRAPLPQPDTLVPNQD